MKFKLYKTYGALNSAPVFSAFEQGLLKQGHTLTENNEDVAVIWSVLWSGRMSANRAIYEECRKNNKPVIIIEVGNLVRGTTWRISEGHINNLGYFGNSTDLDLRRPQKLGILLKPEKAIRRDEILIATQHQSSLQWTNMPPIDIWVKDTVYKIRQYTDRKIVVRPHPRSPIRGNMPGIVLDMPKKIAGTYDNFNIDYNFHCVVNHNSGPAVQAAIYGTPVVCDSSSLAGEISEKYENIENPRLPNRDEWFLKLSHTEWTVEEIAQGIPQSRLTSHLEQMLSKTS